MNHFPFEFGHPIFSDSGSLNFLTNDWTNHDDGQVEGRSTPYNVLGEPSCMGFGQKVTRFKVYPKQTVWPLKNGGLEIWKIVSPA